ncbi:MerR family transcriptional regulator [Pseudonocardia eucalypti]|uniref:MerR family transcriptional regulator n=2 Tax=Pseudonocardia eucalypti TaxID=648755 RepID=A0ABP9QQQ9_9PSEU
MAELSRESGVPVATIKYYLRERLLPPGERTSPNQALYDETHIRRLKLIRALLEVGGLSVATVADVLAALDEQISTHKVLGIASHGLPMPKAGGDAQAREWAAEQVDRVVAERGWQLRPDHPVVDSLVGTLSAFAELGRPELIAQLSGYAELADRIAELDLRTIADLPSTESIVEGAVIATVLGDVVFAALRRLAQQQVSARTFGDRSG